MYNRQLDHYGNHNGDHYILLCYGLSSLLKKIPRVKKILEFLKFDIHAILQLKHSKFANM